MQKVIFTIVLLDLQIFLCLIIEWASLVAHNVKESACYAGDPGSIPGLGRSPGGLHDNPLQYSCPENRHKQRSLVGYKSMGWQRVRHD